MTCSEDPTCQELLDHLYELVDADEDAIDGRSRALLAAHAALCPSCRDAVDAERHVRDLVRRCCGESVHAPAALRVRVVSMTTRVRRTE